MGSCITSRVGERNEGLKVLTDGQGFCTDQREIAQIKDLNFVILRSEAVVL